MIIKEKIAYFSIKHMLWVLIKMHRQCDSNEYPQHGKGILRAKKKSCFRFPDRPNRIDVKKVVFFQPLSENFFFAYRLALRGQKKKYKTSTNRKYYELPKGGEINVLVCFVSFI